MKITTGKGQVECHSVGFPKRRNYSRGSGDTLHLKNQSEQLPEPSNSPINWKQMKNLSKPNASQKKSSLE